MWKPTRLPAASGLLTIVFASAVSFAEAPPDLARARQVLQAELLERQDAAGGFPYRRSGMAFADATAWCLLAMGQRGFHADSGRRARAFLDACRRGEAYAASAGDPDPSWMTIPVTLALLASDPRDTHGGAAARWLLERFQAQSEPGKPAPGWPWTQGCAPWVEPTALALLALAHAGAADHARAREGLAMVVANQSRGGGWSLYARRPHVYHTGLVLMALQALRHASADESIIPESSKHELLAARAFLVGAAPRSRSPLDLAAATLALVAARDPAAAPLTRLLVERVTAAPRQLDTLAAALSLVAVRHARGEAVMPRLVQKAPR